MPLDDEPTYAMLPIGGHFTMDPQGAALAARLLKVKTVIPMHYGTFRLSYEPLEEPPERLVACAESHGLGDRITVMREGEPMVF